MILITVPLKPGWMKDTSTMNGGNLLSQYYGVCKSNHNILLAVSIDDDHKDPTYLLKAVQGFQSKGIPIYAISIQVRLPHGTRTRE